MGVPRLRGPFLRGVLIIRTFVYQGLYLGPPDSGFSNV